MHDGEAIVQCRGMEGLIECGIVEAAEVLSCASGDRRSTGPLESLSHLRPCLEDHISEISDLRRIRIRLPDEDRVIGEEVRSEEHTSELQSRGQLVCRLLLEK